MKFVVGFIFVRVYFSAALFLAMFLFIYENRNCYCNKNDKFKLIRLKVRITVVKIALIWGRVSIVILM